MGFQENFRIALRALSANKLRSGLTMLGIIIGVGAVVALMAVGNGATADITSQVQNIGSNLVSVSPGRFQQGNAQQRTSFIYYVDYEVLQQNLKNVSDIVPSFQRGMTVTYANSTQDMNIVATTSRYNVVRAYEVELGRFLTENDRATRARVAVIGSQTAKDFFSGLNPIGRVIKINSLEFEVVGKLKEKGSAGFGNQDSLVLVPLETGYEKLFGSGAVNNGKLRVTDISMSAVSPEAVNDVLVQVDRTLRQQHGITLSGTPDFTVTSQASFLSVLSTITTTLTAFLGFIAGISLLVGGIGIMNIMLVSVTERTREIGLRKAVGATRRTILIQFLVETLVLSLVGGFLGIALGWSAAAIIRALNVVKAQVTLDSVLLAFSLSAAVGIFFGLYPAFRASRLQPIEALRYE
jgi:putative ABC transport system permease protein